MDIGLFDSGSGGLTVLKEIVKMKPNNRFIYLADTANLPYGNKTREQILSYGDLKMQWMKSMGVDIVSIACNTTDSVLYDQAYRYNNFFKYGIIHIIHPTVSGIVHNYKVKKIGIIATEATARSKVFDNAFKQISDIETLSVSCPELVPWIESEDSDYEAGYKLIDGYIKPLIDFKIDSLIYGCSHYQFISHLINDILNNYKMEIQLFDPAQFVAEAISKMPLDDSQFSIEFYVTDIKAKSQLLSRVEKMFGLKPEIRLTTIW